MNGVGRSQEFYEGSENVRQPQFHTVQQDGPRGYQANSTLAQLLPGVNGMAYRDYQRNLLGVRHAPVGQSDETFDKSLWLRKQEPTSIYQKTFGED